ncbi:MAG: SDR family NAD(P)-dependent oxidoreductase [Pseudomonadales bacterium]
MNIDLSGQVALVTGGSRGLGKAISLGLADAGADIIIASRKIENCEKVAAEVEAKGRQALAVAAHTADMASLDALIDAAYERFGKIDLLVNNAGTNPAMGTLSDLSPELFDKMMGINVKGPWYLASRIAPKMGAAGGGSIINMISVSGIRPAAYQGFYSCNKAALDALTKVMAAEWADMNIRVNAIAPGSYHSDLFDISAAAMPGFEDGAKEASMMKRIAATEEILGPVLYLASDLGSFTTGSTVVADGGYLAK